MPKNGARRRGQVFRRARSTPTQIQPHKTRDEHHCFRRSTYRFARSIDQGDLLDRNPTLKIATLDQQESGVESCPLKNHLQQSEENHRSRRLPTNPNRPYLHRHIIILLRNTTQHNMHRKEDILWHLIRNIRTAPLRRTHLLRYHRVDIHPCHRCTNSQHMVIREQDHQALLSLQTLSLFRPHRWLSVPHHHP
jgi:hypothetical protein